MYPVIQMPAHDSQPAASLLRKGLESFARCANSVRINREDGKRVILPFNDPVECRPGCFWNVKKNQCGAVRWRHKRNRGPDTRNRTSSSFPWHLAGYLLL